jgi:hypothetical protein
MRTASATRAWALALGLALLVPTGAAAGSTSLAPAGVVDRLPDMKMAKLYGMDLVRRPNGRVRLHFGTIGWNVGDGPLEVRGRRVDPADDYMQVKQRILRSDGSSRIRRTSSIMFYATDGHDHWHVNQFMVIELYTRGDPNAHVLGLRKLGYCLLDARRMPAPPPRSPARAVYRDCGHRGDDSVITGLSVGYGDDYPPSFAHQWVDVTELPAVGVYRICATVDPLRQFVEKNEGNNQRWTDVRIDKPADDVDVLRTGVGSCGPTSG